MVDRPPPRAGWIHEVKHDGYRTLLVVERRKARAYTRNGFDWTKRGRALGIPGRARGINPRRSPGELLGLLPISKPIAFDLLLETARGRLASLLRMCHSGLLFGTTPRQ